MLPGQHTVADLPLVAGERCSLAKVSRKLRGVGHDVGGVEPLQRLADADVKHGAPGLRQAPGQRLLSEDVGESVPPGVVGHLIDHAGHHGLVQDIKELVLWLQVHQAVELVETELVADHRGHGQALCDLGRKMAQPSPDNLTHPIRDPLEVAACRVRVELPLL